MANPFLPEILTIVGLVVQTNYSGDSYFFEGRDIVIGSKGSVLG